MDDTPQKNLSIGMFDSGVGGLTVLQELQKTLPHENTIYFGDTARLPYGGKSGSTILRYSIENAIFLIEKNIKLLVIACNTASAYALGKLQQICKIPVVGVIEPGVEKAVQTTRKKRIAVLGTKGTINSGVYQKELEKRLPGASVISVACPLFVPIVEERFVNHPSARLIVREYLAPLRKENVDTVLLGCTHYPLLKPLIQEEMGNGVEIVDSATSCAEKVAHVLDDLQLHKGDRDIGVHQFFVSDDPHKFGRLAEEFLGKPISHVESASSLPLS